MLLPPFYLERYFARYEFSVQHLLSSSDCESMSIGELLALEPGASAKLHDLWLGYTESAGSPPLREAIAGMYTSQSASDILVHSGAEEAIFLFMHAVLAPEDHVVVHWPCYQSLLEVPRALGCAVDFWQAREDHNWALDLDALQRLLRPNTKAIIINVPHNPTGYLLPRDVFQELCRLAEKRGILLFCDEVYRESEYDPAQRLPAACDLCHTGISLGVTSKTYGLPGLRIGWLATKQHDVLAAVAQMKDYTTICNSAASEFLAEIALRHRQYLAERSVSLIQHNLDLLDGFFARHVERFVWQRPQAGPIAFPRLRSENADAFCQRAVDEASVLLLPGSLYDYPGGAFRIGFGRANMPQALEALEAILAS